MNINGWGFERFPKKQVLQNEKDMPLNKRDLIEAAYLLLLGREPDEEGLRVHLNAQLKPEALARSILFSTEFRQKQSALKTVRIYGLEFLVPDSEMMYDGEYEPHVFKELMNRMGPGVTFLDVGANIGLFSIHAAKLGARVIAMEPKPSNTRLLLENVRRNGVSVELHPVAASSEAGYAVLYLSENTNAGIRKLEATSLGDEVVATQSIDVIVGNRRVDVIKIDIEGHEYMAMRGAHNLLSAYQPVIVTEYSSEFQRQGSGVDGKTYLDLLRSYGYSPAVLRDGGPQPVKWEAVDSVWKQAPTHIDLLLQRAG